MEDKILELIDLKVEVRQNSGKGSARKLRNQNMLPGILYGPETEPIMLSVATVDLNKLIVNHGSSGVFINLAVEGDSKAVRTVLLKEVQMDTFGLNYLHADFQEIDMNKKITIFVPVDAIGESIGVKEGGLLQIIRRELEVTCFPADVPDAITIDITDLTVGDVIHVSEIDVDEAVEIPHEVDFTVLTVVPPTKVTVEEEEVEEGFEAEEGEEAAGEEPSEPSETA